ncbi:MAG: efflux RND transporter periplasmic adaptor subunit [Ferrovibrionaceae bacterium]
MAFGKLNTRPAGVAVPGLLIVAGVLIFATLALTGCDQAPHAANAQGGAHPPPEVGVITVTKGPVTLTTELPGRTSSFVIAEVRPQVGGIIQKRLFTEGAEIKAGQVLYQIDPATYQAAFDSAKAALAKAEANVTVAKLKADRYKELSAINAVSKQSHDDAIAALKQAEADVAADKAALQSARINLDYTTVVSPISGRIGKSSVTQGALVTANQSQALATVQQLDPIYVDVTQPTTVALRLKRELETGRLKRAGDKQAAQVKLIMSDGSVYPHDGTLAFTDVTVEPTTSSITVRAVFPNPNRDLLPGMYVRAVLQEGVDDQAILVPQQAVARNPQGKATALLLGADGKVEQRVIEAERAIGDKWLVTSGLQGGEQLIVDGVQKVRPGAPAKAVPVQLGSLGDKPAAPKL